MDIHRRLFRTPPVNPEWFDKSTLVLDPARDYEKLVVPIQYAGQWHDLEYAKLCMGGNEEDVVLFPWCEYEDDKQHLKTGEPTVVIAAMRYDYYGADYHVRKFAACGNVRIIRCRGTKFVVYHGGQYPSQATMGIVSRVAGYSYVYGDLVGSWSEDERTAWFRKCGNDLLRLVNIHDISREERERLIAIHGRPGYEYFWTRELVLHALSGKGNVEKRECDACGRRRFVFRRNLDDRRVMYSYDSKGKFFYGIEDLFPCSEKCARKLYGWFLFKTRDEIREERSWRKLHELQKRARQALKENDREALLSLHREYERLVTSRT